MEINASHNLSPTELNKTLAGMAIGSGIEDELLEMLQKAVKRSTCDDQEPKLPRHRATRTLYAMMRQQYVAACRDIERYAAMISTGQLQKAMHAGPLTADQLRQLQQAINDRFGFIGAQLQSVDYQPAPDLLERWKQLGLVDVGITPETFAASIPAEVHFIRNAFLMGKFIEAVESGKSYQEVMHLALYAPILAPDLHAIAVAEQQTALYLTDNAADLATKVGQLAIQKRNETIRQMAVDYHGRKLKRTVLDEEAKRDAGIEIPERYVENWPQFKSELHQTMEDKARDWDRVAYYELTDAQKQGQAYKLLQDGNVDKLVYKMPLATACAQCKHLFLKSDGKTPRVFKLSRLINNGTNIGRKPYPVRGGKTVPVGRSDGAETLKAVVGLVHPWCACAGPYEYTGYEPWAKEGKKP